MKVLITFCIGLIEQDPILRKATCLKKNTGTEITQLGTLSNIIPNQSLIVTVSGS